jgi:DnaJ domain
VAACGWLRRRIAVGGNRQPIDRALPRRRAGAGVAKRASRAPVGGDIRTVLLLPETVEAQARSLGLALRMDWTHKPLSRPAAGDRANEWSRFDANDARVVLGVAADATEQEIHAAWRDLAKAYHPDRLAAFGLPDEVLRHADRVLARINAAFQRLKNDASAQSD